MDDLSNLVFDIKEKITDGEFKNIMEKLRDIKINTKLPYEITYIKTNLLQDDNNEELEVQQIISKGYGMINESDEETIRNEIEADGVAKVHYRLFQEIMGYKKCDCCAFRRRVHLRVLDECEDNIDYNTYFIMVVRIKQIKTI